MTAFGCINNTIRLRSGLYLDLANPAPDQFTFADIAGALSKICRFGGQVEKFYSVAEHLYWCAIVARNDGHGNATQRAVLLHDATEAFLGDVVKPLKIMLPEYDVIEARMEAAIAEKFAVDFAKEKPVVKEIDRAMLIAERHALFSVDDYKWQGEDEVRKLNIRIRGYGPCDAEAFFTDMARAVGITTDSRTPDVCWQR